MSYPDAHNILYAIPSDVKDESDYMWVTTNLGFISIPIWVFIHIAENGYYKQKDGTRIYSPKTK